MFTDEEIAAFSNVARYTALDRLHRSYAAVHMDLSTAMHYLAKVDAKVTLRYRLEEFGSLIELNGVVPVLPPAVFELPPTPDLVLRHREQYERLLLDHHCEMIIEQEARNARHAVAQLDLSILQSAITSISTGETMESSFQVRGAGGTFEGSVCRKSLPLLKTQLCATIAIASVATIAVVAGILVGFAAKEYRLFAVCGIWGAVVALPALWIRVAEKHQEVRDYERGTSTRFAKVQR